MNDFKGKFITFILTILIICVFIVTTVFYCDLFGIIEIPEKYSLAQLFNEKLGIETPYKENENSTNIDKTIYEKTTSQDENVTVVSTPAKPTDLEEGSFQENPVEDNKNDESVSDWYYSQLDEYGKKIYDEMSNHKDDLKSGTYIINFGKDFDELLKREDGSEILNNAFQLSVNSFMFDHPEVFYIDITKLYLLTQTTTRAFSKTYEVSIGPNNGTYLSDEFLAVNVNNYITEVEDIKRKVRYSINSTDEYVIVKELHDYLISNMEYEKNITSSNVYNIYGALKQNKAVCEGYAKAFKYLLDSFDIPNVIAVGTGRNSTGEIERHAWNYIKLKDEWYGVDVTWDDPIIIGNGRVTNDIKYKYFLKGSNKFFEDHFEDGEIVDSFTFLYPNLSVLDY